MLDASLSLSFVEIPDALLSSSFLIHSLKALIAGFEVNIHF